MASAAVRAATVADIDALVRLRGYMFEAMGADMSDSGWRQVASRWFDERIEAPDYCIRVVADSYRVFACAMGVIRDAAPSPSAPSGRDVLISNVVTDPEYRRRGYAQLAFDAVMAWARSTSVERVELLATGEGRHMYEHAGFTLSPFPVMRARLGG